MVNLVESVESAPNTSGCDHGRSDVFETGHAHTEGRKERVWLERIPDEPSTMEIHSYCSICGRVRPKNGQGRQPSFFVEAVSRLVSMLSGRSRIVEVQARLMVRSIMNDDTIHDSCYSPYSLQAERYAEIVRSCRPDIDDRLILRSLSPDRNGRKRSDNGKGSDTPVNAGDPDRR